METRIRKMLKAFFTVSMVLAFSAVPQSSAFAPSCNRLPMRHTSSRSTACLKSTSMQLFGQNDGKGPFNIRQDQIGDVVGSGLASLARIGVGAFVSGYRAEIDTEYKNPTAELPIREYSEVRR